MAVIVILNTKKQKQILQTIHLTHTQLYWNQSMNHLWLRTKRQYWWSNKAAFSTLTCPNNFKYRHIAPKDVLTHNSNSSNNLKWDFCKNTIRTSHYQTRKVTTRSCRPMIRTKRTHSNYSTSRWSQKGLSWNSNRCIWLTFTSCGKPCQ